MDWLSPPAMTGMCGLKPSVPEIRSDLLHVGIEGRKVGGGQCEGVDDLLVDDDELDNVLVVDREREHR